MTNIQDEWVTNETMRGKVVLYNFVYTNCGASCDNLMTKIQTVWQQLDSDDVPVEFVTITIDPERDSPSVLAKYAETYALTSTVETVPWHFLREEDPKRVRIMVSSGFDFYYEKVVETDGSYHYKFVPMIVLIDAWGIIRSEYRQYEVDKLRFSDSPDIDPNVILRDIGLVTQEIRNSTGVAASAYEAAHLFSCYPP
ncbi:SCO family protein [Anaerolineales bacterium HSG6]|nr:SCO family protein [Anaerolineales bacterium HSG6]MDM8532308.1 SCO family protein [Anaerolineales bacterium HSG25]